MAPSTSHVVRLPIPTTSGASASILPDAPPPPQILEEGHARSYLSGGRPVALLFSLAACVESVRFDRAFVVLILRKEEDRRSEDVRRGSNRPGCRQRIRNVQGRIRRGRCPESRLSIDRRQTSSPGRYTERITKMMIITIVASTNKLI